MKQVIVVRRDLNMTRGKEAAQVAHAALMSVVNRLDDAGVRAWIKDGQAKVVLSAKDGAELLELAQRAEGVGIYVQTVIDAGRTMFHGHPTLTCAAFGPDSAEKLDAITGSMKLR